MPKTGLPESDTKPQSGAGAGKHEAIAILQQHYNSAGASAGASALFQNHQIADPIEFKRARPELEVPVRNLELLQTLMRYPASDELALTVGS